MRAKYATFEVRQGDTFNEHLVLEDTRTGNAVDLTDTTIEAYLIRGSSSIRLDIIISNAADGSFSINKSSADTATWEVDDYEGYIALVEAGARTSSDNFTVSVIEGAVDVQN